MGFQVAARKLSRRGLRRRPRGGRLPAQVIIATAAVPALVGAGIVGTALFGGGTRIEPAVAGDTPFTFAGHGFGHGRGMGQYGALGYAKQGWTAERIVDHYYGGTVLGPTDRTGITVRLTANDGKPVSVYSDAGGAVAGQQLAPGQAATLTPRGTGADVVITDRCGGNVVWQGATDHPFVDPVNLAPNRPAGEALKLCGTGTAYRGSIGAASDGGSARTVNAVNLEDYLLGVVPAESVPKWADEGGAEALRAQAIAARSYALAERRASWADTCDTQDCQVYGGVAKEDARTSDAVHTTAGKTLLKNGAPVRAEFSSSTGGYTAGGEFPAVPDDGDGASPNHYWTQTVTAQQIADAYQVGQLNGIEIVERNGLGADGGRATKVRISGTSGTAEVDGADVRKRLKLKSDWFNVAQGTTPPPMDQSSPTPQAADPLSGLLAGSGSSDALGDQLSDLLGGVLNGAAATSDDPIGDKWAQTGGEAGPLGAALGAQMDVPGGEGRFQLFTNGVIIWTPTLGAQVVDVNQLAKLGG